MGMFTLLYRSASIPPIGPPEEPHVAQVSSGLFRTSHSTSSDRCCATPLFLSCLSLSCPKRVVVAVLAAANANSKSCCLLGLPSLPVSAVDPLHPAATLGQAFPQHSVHHTHFSSLSLPACLSLPSALHSASSPAKCPAKGGLPSASGLEIS